MVIESCEKDKDRLKGKTSSQSEDSWSFEDDLNLLYEVLVKYNFLQEKYAKKEKRIAELEKENQELIKTLEKLGVNVTDHDSSVKIPPD